MFAWKQTILKIILLINLRAHDKNVAFLDQHQKQNSIFRQEKKYNLSLISFFGTSASKLRKAVTMNIISIDQ